MPWTDRTIRGPADDYIDADDFRKLFKFLPREWFDRAVKAGVIPPPVRLSDRTVFYTWEHAVYLSLWLKFFGDEGPADKKRPAANEES